MPSNRPISIVINVYNEEEEIRDCLDSLDKQTLSEFELVIVDDGSTDDTMKIVEEYEDSFDMKKLFLEHKGLKKARKRGVGESTGEIIVIVDADEILESDFLENLTEPFEDEGVGAVGGRLESEGEGWVTEAYGALNEGFYGLRAEDEGVDWIQGGCAAFRRKALREVGGLADERVSEDKDISWKMKDEGWKVLLQESAVAHHKDPQTLRSVMNREYDIGKREYFLLKEHKNRMSWKELARFSSLIGLILLGLVPFYFPLIMLLVIGVIGLIGGVVYLIRGTTEGFSGKIYLTASVVLFLINLAWSLGFIKRIFQF